MATFLRWWLAIVLLAALQGPSVLRPAYAGDPCVLCQGAKTIACPTCDGKAVATSVCDLCGGEGRGRCNRRPRTIGKLPADWAEFFGIHKGTSTKCPNVGCKKGKVEIAKATCKLCGGSGTAKCLICSEACAACGGKKTRNGPCPDCSGTGKLSCLLCAAPGAPCAACGDRKSLDCTACKASGHSLDVCAACAGRGRSLCPLCSGVGKEGCVACFGCGNNALSAMGTSSAAPKCVMCDGKGVAACAACQQGWIQCRACEGRKTLDAKCRKCEGTRQVECTSCDPVSFRVLELEGMRLTKTSPGEPAARLLGRAADVATARMKRAEDAASAADDALTDRINAIDVGADFKNAGRTIAEARAALTKYCEAAAVADDARAASKRVDGELAEAKRPVPAKPAGK